MEDDNIALPNPETVEKFQKRGLEIRPDRGEEDLEQVKNLKMHIYEEEGLSPSLAIKYRHEEEAFEEEFYGPEGQDPEKRVYYVVEDPEEDVFDQPLVGCGGLIQKDPQEDPEVGEIVDIYFHQNIRGVKLGKALVGDLKDRARELGFKSLFLSSRREFPVANRLFEKLGFERASKQRYNSGEYEREDPFEYKLEF